MYLGTKRLSGRISTCSGRDGCRGTGSESTFRDQALSLGLGLGLGLLGWPRDGQEDNAGSTTDIEPERTGLLDKEDLALRSGQRREGRSRG